MISRIAAVNAKPPKSTVASLRLALPKKNNNKDNDLCPPPKKLRSERAPKLSSEEYKKRLTDLLKNGKPDDVCTLTDNHKGHKIKDCKALNKAKANKSGTASGSYAVVSYETAPSTDNNDNMDTDSITSKETNASTNSSKEKCMFSVNSTPIQSHYINSLPHHIDLCPTEDSLTVDTNILDDLTTTYVSYKTSTWRSL